MADATAFSEASRMDKHYRYQRLVYDWTRKNYLIGRQHLINDLKPKPGSSVLEIGCGTAWNLAQACKLYPEAKFFGVDVSTAMLETAHTSLQRKGLNQHIVLRQGDGTNFDAHALFGQSTFDHVFFSYALSMIPDWDIALKNAFGLLAPGGRLHIVDFGQCDRLPRVVKRALFQFLNHFSVTPRGELEAVLQEMAAQGAYDVQSSRLHRGYTDYYVVTRHR